MHCVAYARTDMQVTPHALGNQQPAVLDKVFVQDDHLR